MILIRNIHAVDPDNLNSKVDLVIENNLIKKIAPANSIKSDAFDLVIEGDGLCAIPGLVDAHCHLREPGQEYKEDIESGTRAAAKGGFTAVACMPNTLPVADNSAVISYILDAARTRGAVKVLPIGAITKSLQGKELAEIGDMKNAGAVAISDDGRPVMSASLMKKAMLYASGFDMPVISHCEDLDLAEGGSMNEGFNSTCLGLRGIPRAAEESMVSRELILAEYTGLPVHIAHVSTRLSVELIRQAKKRGVSVTCETCPHYFTLTDNAVLGFNTNAKVNPPLREEEDVHAIIEGLKDGTIDIIATDHAPHHQDEKRVEFELAANGISGFESAFGLSYTYLVRSVMVMSATLPSFSPPGRLKSLRGFADNFRISSVKER
ncbi:MAG: dihydroorotase [Clostridiales bacterium]|nr:dihydroorotase [Clostridiales bacterium]